MTWWLLAWSTLLVLTTGLGSFVPHHLGHARLLLPHALRQLSFVVSSQPLRSQVIAPAPIRVDMRASHVHASPPRTIRSDTVQEEVNSPAPHLGLSLGQPIQVPSDST